MKARTLYIIMFVATMGALVGVAYLQYRGNETASDTNRKVLKIERETIPCLADERCRKVLKSVVARNEHKPISKVQLPSLKEAEREIEKETVVTPVEGKSPESGGREPKQPQTHNPTNPPKGGGGGGGSPGGNGAGGGAAPGGSDNSGGQAPGNSGGSEGSSGGGSDNGSAGSSSSAGVTVAPESGVACVEVPSVEVPKVLETKPLQVGC